ncbi:unnamed protein product, partial [Allacma fusca]
ILASIKRAK